MNEKNQTALLQWGAKKILADMANVPGPITIPKAIRAAELLEKYPEAELAAREFVEQYGPLRHETDIAIFEVAVYAPSFRFAWNARNEQEKQLVSDFLDGIFAAPVTAGDRAIPAIRADFASGKWSPVPRTLLDVIAVELMCSRKMLHRCERPECQRYFVKEFSRDRYCSLVCSEEMRRRGQLQWQQDHREQVNARRRGSTFPKRRLRDKAKKGGH